MDVVAAVVTDVAGAGTAVVLSSCACSGFIQSALYRGLLVALFRELNNF